MKTEAKRITYLGSFEFAFFDDILAPPLHLAKLELLNGCFEIVERSPLGFDLSLERAGPISFRISHHPQVDSRHTLLDRRLRLLDTLLKVDTDGVHRSQPSEQSIPEDSKVCRRRVILYHQFL
jgi:hypothetical protein